MRLLFAALALVSFSAFANDIIKITDGAAAFCESKADVRAYQNVGIYRPLKFVRTNEGATLTVEFLRCVQDGEKFMFVRDDSFESRQNSGVEIKRSLISAVTFSSEGRIYNNTVLKKLPDNTYSQTIALDGSEFESDRNGDHFFEMAISFKVKVTDLNDGRVIDQKIEFLGSYRVFVK